jgi:hypothetical protein
VRIIFVLVLAMALSSTTFAGFERVVLDELQIAKVLSGIITDPSGEVVPGVQVLEVTPDDKITLRTTTTDSERRWSLPPVASRSVYHLRFVKDGFNELQVRVKLGKQGKGLRLVLPIAT